jgi:hypothetical protein
MKNLIFILIILWLPASAQQKISYQYDGDELYEYVGKEFTSSRVQALLIHYNLKADGKKVQYDNANNGIAMTIEKGKLSILTLIIKGDNATQSFAGMLPEGLMPGMSASETLKQLGEGATKDGQVVTYVKGEVTLRVYFTKGAGKKMESISMEYKGK